MSNISNSHVFISYSRRDTDVMQRIVYRLRSHGINAWVDNEKLVPGTPVWEKELEKAIKAAFAIVVVLSPEAKDSQWVMRELTLADEYKKRIFPVLVRGERLDAMPFRLIERQFVDIRYEEETGLNSLKTAISFYIEELTAQEEKEREEAEKLARAEEELKAAEQKSERLRLENEAAEKAAREAEEKAAREKTEKEAFKREAMRLELESKASAEAERLALEKAEKERKEREAAEEAERIALNKANKEKIEREAAEREAIQLKAERSAAQKNFFSKIGYAWANWSVGKKALLIFITLTLGTALSCIGFFANSVMQAIKDGARPYAPVQFVLPGQNPTNIPETEQPQIIYTAAYSPNGKFIIADDRSNGYQIWDVTNGTIIKNIKDYGSAATYSLDGNLLATTASNKIHLHNTNDDTLPIITLDGHASGITDLAFSPDDKTIASASYDNTVKIWDLDKDNTALTLEGHSDIVNSIAFSFDGKILFSGSEDKTVRVWKTDNGELINTLQETTPVNAVAFSPKGVFAISTNNSIKLMDKNSFQVLFEINEDYGQCIAFSPDGNILAVGMIDSNILLINTDTGEITNTLSGHTSYVKSVAFSPDGQHLVSSAADGTIRLWEIVP